MKTGPGSGEKNISHPVAEMTLSLVAGGSGQHRGLARFTSLAGNVVLHLLLAMIACPVMAAVGIAIFNPFVQRLPSSLVYFAAIVEIAVLSLGPGFILGYLVNFTGLRRMSFLVSLVGLAWMAVGVCEAVQRYAYQPRWYGTCSSIDNLTNTFFLMDQNKCGGGSEVLDGILFTMPGLSALAYSAGSWGMDTMGSESNRIADDLPLHPLQS